MTQNNETILITPEEEEKEETFIALMKAIRIALYEEEVETLPDED